MERHIRPDPDALLQQVVAEEQQQKRGRLKVFFGACAGVGKTYAMLQAARVHKADGMDVVVGIAETHGRKETEALLAGLERLAPRFIEYKNTKLREFDLDGALARRPALILVDELAHTNAPGCKNAKRWQDIKDLLNAGINVYTTLNVQHLETLNDVVAQITTIAVRETLPDSVIEEADEIELIDLPPDDLLKRLQEGKVYLAEQAEQAATHFFRKGNLIALRELALRCAADRVNKQVESYRQEKSIATTWPTAERILVCVSPSPFSARLVRAARRMAAGLRAEWMAVYVETPALAAMNQRSRQQVKHNLRLAEQLGAETFTLSGRDVVDGLIAFAHSHNVSKIITGKPLQPRWHDRLFGSKVDELIRKSTGIDVYVITGEEEEEPQQPAASAAAATGRAKYGAALLIVALCTPVAAIASRYFTEDNANQIAVYLLGVAITASWYGRGPAILSSILSVLAFDFFFVRPHYSFAVSDWKYLITFAILLAVALLISSLTAQIQRHAESANLRGLRMAALYAISRELAGTRGSEALINILAKHAAQLSDCEVVGLLPDDNGRLTVKAGNETTFPFSARERGVAQWVGDLGRPAGMGTDTLPGAEAVYLPLRAPHPPLSPGGRGWGEGGVVGVLGLHPRRGQPLSADQMTLLETCAAQTALAIEVDRLGEEARKAQVEAEAEKSRSALLSSVSHDLRTPLAAICGSANSLLEQRDKLPREVQQELLQGISDEGQRLARLISNLLEMTRLESGATRVRKELCPLEEVIGSALTRMEPALGGRSVKTEIPPDFPLVPIDVVLIEQVLVNLLENAVKYTPERSPLEISARVEAQGVTVQVADRGPGLLPGDEKKAFEKFYRGPVGDKTSGVGLGLAICHAIIAAHGGRIWAGNRPGGGAIFSFSIPLSGSPDPDNSPQSR